MNQRRFWVSISFLMCCVLLCLGSISCDWGKAPLPIFSQIPDFNLLNEQGKPISLQAMKNKIWVGNFIFTSCAGTCPMLTRRMKRVEAAILEEAKQRPDLPLRILSFSVDPERDTPEKLKEYGKLFEVNPNYWSFLTGDVEQISKTVVEGFKISMKKVALASPAPDQENQTDFDVIHGEKFVLVDASGQIRGYYDSDRAGITQLIRDMFFLEKKLSKNPS